LCTITSLKKYGKYFRHKIQETFDKKRTAHIDFESMVCYNTQMKKLTRIYDHYINFLRQKSPKAASIIIPNKTSIKFARPYFPAFDLSQIDAKKAGLAKVEDMLHGDLSQIEYHIPIGHLPMQFEEHKYRMLIPQASRPNEKNFLNYMKMIPVKKNSGVSTWLLDKLESSDSFFTVQDRGFYQSCLELEAFLNENAEEITQRAMELRENYPADIPEKLLQTISKFPLLEKAAAQYRKVSNRTSTTKKAYKYKDKDNGLANPKDFRFQDGGRTKNKKPKDKFTPDLGDDW